MRKRPVRWLTALVVLGVIVVSGTVVADVVLAYTANNSVGPNGTSQFQFTDGSNAAAAKSAGVATNAYPGGGSSGVTVTTTIDGIALIPVEALQVTLFQTAVLTTNTAAIGNVLVPSASSITVTNVVCAYAFVSDAVQTYGTTLAGSAACGATIPTLGALSAGCSTGTSGQAIVNLLTGAVTGTTWTCSVPSGTAASTSVLYVSYAITTSGPVAGTTVLNSFSIPVTLT